MYKSLELFKEIVAFIPDHFKQNKKGLHQNEFGFKKKFKHEN